MLKRPERPPATTRNFFAMFIASIGIGLEILAGAEAIGADVLQKDIAHQQAWNAENDAYNAAHNARLMAAYSDEGTVAQPTVVADEPILHIPRHETQALEPMVHDLQRKQRDSRRNGLFGGIALFLMGGSMTNRRIRNQRRAAEEAQAQAAMPEPIIPEYEPHGATAFTQSGMQVSVFIAESAPPARANVDGRADIATDLGWLHRPFAAHGQNTTRTAADEPAFTLQLLQEVRVDHVPPEDEIDPRYVQQFEPTVYLASTYDNSFDVLERTLDRPPQPTRLQRWSVRQRSLAAAWTLQLEATRGSEVDYSPLPPLDSPVLVGGAAPSPSAPAPALVALELPKCSC